jgi:hypothetical protein
MAKKHKGYSYYRNGKLIRVKSTLGKGKGRGKGKGGKGKKRGSRGGPRMF